jgi:hypothetical protein
MGRQNYNSLHMDRSICQYWAVVGVILLFYLVIKTTVPSQIKHWLEIYRGSISQTLFGPEMVGVSKAESGNMSSLPAQPEGATGNGFATIKVTNF